VAALCVLAGMHVYITRHLQGSFHTKHRMLCVESHAAHLAGMSFTLLLESH